MILNSEQVKSIQLNVYMIVIQARKTDYAQAVS